MEEEENLISNFSLLSNLFNCSFIKSTSKWNREKTNDI